MPTKAEKPAPNRLSARPVAYWLVLSQITSTPKQRRQQRAGAPRRRAKPSQSLPVCTAVAKPAIAAHQHHALGAEVDDAGASR